MVARKKFISDDDKVIVVGIETENEMVDSVSPIGRESESEMVAAVNFGDDEKDAKDDEESDEASEQSESDPVVDWDAAPGLTGLIARGAYNHYFLMYLFWLIIGEIAQSM